MHAYASAQICHGLKCFSASVLAALAGAMVDALHRTNASVSFSPCSENKGHRPEIANCDTCRRRLGNMALRCCCWPASACSPVAWRLHSLRIRRGNRTSSPSTGLPQVAGSCRSEHYAWTCLRTSSTLLSLTEGWGVSGIE